MVIGLGRFGTAVARTLIELGHEVLGIDDDPARVAELRDVLTHVVQADTSDPVALEQAGARDFDRVVVAIGTDLEASVLTVAALVDLGIPEIWAKATTTAHGRILERVGAHHVVFPEADMGVRAAHVMDGSMLDFIALDPGFALAELRAPRAITGRSLGDLGVRARYGVTVVCIKPAGGAFTYATPDTVVEPDDLVVIAGVTSKVEEFAQLR